MFVLDLSCRNCNINRLNQIIDYIQAAWDSINLGTSKGTDDFWSIYLDDPFLIAVDLVFYWDKSNTKEIQNYLNSDFQDGKKLIAVINYPEFNDDKYPIIPPLGYRWKYILNGNFMVLERYSFTDLSIVFLIVDQDYQSKGNSIREI